MKKLTLALFTVFSVSVFAQEKTFVTDAVLSVDKRNDIPDAKNQIEEAGKIIKNKGGAVDPKVMNKYLYYNGLINYKIAISDKPEIKALDPNALEIAADSWLEVVDFEAKNNLKRYTADAQIFLPSVSIEFAKRGYAKNDAKDFEGSKTDLLKSYEIRKNPALGQYALVDTTMLYNAALIASFGKDYETAATLALQVLDMGYNGYTFSATSAANGEQVSFMTKSEMEQQAKLGLVTDPKVSESVRADIYKFLLSVYQNKEDKENFRKILSKARAEFPSSKDFIDYELDEYLKSKDYDKALSIVDEAIAKDPTNYLYYYVKAYVYQTMDSNDKAFEFYNKALEFNPSHFESNYSIGLIYYNRGKETIEKMNELGISAADQKKYDQLKKVKEGHFKESTPYFEKCHEVDPKDKETVKALWEVYRQTGQSEKSLKMKQLLDEMG